MKNEADKAFHPSLGWSIVKLLLAVAMGVLILFLGTQACVVLFHHVNPMYRGIAEILRVVVCIGALAVPLWGVFQMGHTVVTRRRIGRGERQLGEEKALEQQSTTHTMDMEMEKSRIIARFKKNYLAILHWGPAVALMDGTKRFTIPWWRDAVLDIEHGKHNIKIAINYLLILRGICKADIDFEVAPGETVRLEYRHPLTIFQRGRIDLIEKR